MAWKSRLKHKGGSLSGIRRVILLELLDRHAGDREGDAEAALVQADGIEQHPVGGEIAALSNLAQDLGVLELVEVVPVRVEHAVAAEAEGLVDLEIKADGRHKTSLFVLSAAFAAGECKEGDILPVPPNCSTRPS